MGRHRNGDVRREMGRDQSPTILIDASDIDKPSGGRTAVFELFRALFAREPNWHYVVLVSRREPDFAPFPYVRQLVVPVRNRVLERLWVQLVVGYFALVKRVEIVHFARTLAGVSWPAKNVLTVFDLTTLRHPELHSRAAVWFWRYLHPLLMRGADLLIAISRNVARDLVCELNMPPEKIEVVYCAPQSVFEAPPSPQACEDVRRKHELPEQYMLFVGMLARKKNLPTLIRALRVLKESDHDFPPLIIAGRRYRQSDDVAIFQQIRSLGLESDVRYIGPVESEDLPGLYSGAELFIFPSLHEGFGIPCLEAMKCRVPVVAARSGAIPEVVGDAALLVDDPMDANMLAQAIHRILDDSSLRQELVAKGIARSQQFLWPRLADQVLALYRCLLEA